MSGLATDPVRDLPKGCVLDLETPVTARAVVVPINLSVTHLVFVVNLPIDLRDEILWPRPGHHTIACPFNHVAINA